MWGFSPNVNRLVLHGMVRELTKVTVSPVQYISQTSCKNTIVVERWWQIPLSKEGSAPRLYPRRHRVYRLVEDSKHAPKEKMELLLTQTVAKLGGRGDPVFVKKSVGRNKLLPEGLAVYPSPENREMIAEERRLLREGKPEDRIQTRTGQLTAEFLRRTALVVGMQTSIQYEITKEIICRQFLRRLGVVVPTHALTLPDEPITGLGEYWCDVTINGVDTVRVPVSVVALEEPRLRRVGEQQRNPEGIDVEAGEDASVLPAENPKAGHTE